MLSKWPIRRKLLLGLGLLVLVVSILSSTGLVATYAYRNLVNSLSWRVSELPLAAELSRHVSDLRITIGELRGLRLNTFPDSQSRSRADARADGPRPVLLASWTKWIRRLARYRDQLAGEARADPRMSDHEREEETVRKIEAQLATHPRGQPRRRLDARQRQDRLARRGTGTAANARRRSCPAICTRSWPAFPTRFAGNIAVLIVSAWTATVSAVLLFLLFMRLSYRWIFRPLRTLIAGSRRVAAGEFGYRIRLDTDDEMAELAKAMNDMTARFQEIRDDLDRQVQERTKQVVRSEQLASVGFLAAGVAHEINNPLASIAMCAESLEGRFREMLDAERSAAGRGRQLSADDPDRGVPLQGNHRKAAGFLSHRPRQAAKTPNWASWSAA